MRHANFTPGIIRTLRPWFMLFALQLAACPLAAQEPNIQVNDDMPVPRNPVNPMRNYTISAGPNGPNGMVSQLMNANLNVNVNVIDNGVPDVQGFRTSNVQTQQRAAKPARMSKPVASATAPRRKRSSRKPARPKPQAPVTPRRVVSKPQSKPAPAVVTTPAKPIGVPVMQVLVQNPPIVQQQALIRPDDLLTNDAVVQMAEAAPAVNMLAAPAVRRSAMAGGSGTSKMSKRQSKRRHGSFGYQAHKKFQKLFAQHGSRKFDPAKCFVWG